MERYNSRLEGYEAMTALEVIEHLDPHILSRFGVVTMGTYRPRILLVTTPVCLPSSPLLRPTPTFFSISLHMDPHPHQRLRRRLLDWANIQNFDFNAKFPRGHEGHDAPRKGFVDPTGRTERVFR
jgi:hypothetical protein